MSHEGSEERGPDLNDKVSGANGTFVKKRRVWSIAISATTEPRSRSTQAIRDWKGDIVVPSSVLTSRSGALAAVANAVSDILFTLVVESLQRQITEVLRTKTVAGKGKAARTPAREEDKSVALERVLARTALTLKLIEWNDILYVTECR